MATKKAGGKKSGGRTPSNPYDVVFKVLKDAELDPRPYEGGEGYVVSFAEEIYEGGLFEIIEEDDRVLFYLEFRDQAPEERRAEVAEFITRANNGIVVGNFEMDYADGSVRYKTSLDFQDDELSPALVRNLIVAARDGAGAYGEVLAEVIKGEKSAREAIDAVEEPIEEGDES